MESVFILGRQPALGLAELESLYGSGKVRPVPTLAGTAGVALVDIDPAQVDFVRLGGSIKYGKVLTTLDSTKWADVEKHLVHAAPSHAAALPEGKLLIGISVYGVPGVTTQRVLATGLSIKKVVKKSGRPVRLVPNTELELNSASVMHNGLTGTNGWELLIIRDGERTIIAQTLAVQDIDSYTLRDRGRPKRDTRVGMLPPKLAQIIINLAAGPLAPSKDKIVLDPFCGTGVVLMEAALMGFDVYGTDIDKRMVEYTEKNLLWLELLEHEQFEHLDVVDATSAHWSPLPDLVACETYLGRPFTSSPSPEMLAQTVSECNVIIKKFLANAAKQLKSGTRLCVAVPAWQVRSGQFKHLPVLDRSGSVDYLAELGYNRISFEHSRSEDLLYFRPDQYVARELIVLAKR